MEDTRERYECKCSECGKVFWACKSIAQEGWGMLDAGHGSCPSCGTFLNLTFDEENKRMLTMPWELHIEKMKTENATLRR